MTPEVYSPRHSEHVNSKCFDNKIRNDKFEIKINKIIINEGDCPCVEIFFSDKLFDEYC